MTDTTKERMPENVFETGNIPGLYVKLALPLVFSMTVTLVYNLADTFFVARTNNTDLVAGVSLCVPLFTFLMALGNILAQGGSSLISRLMGQGNRESVRRVSSFCFYATLLSGVAVGTVLLISRVPMLQLLGTDSDTFSYASDYFIWLAIGSPFIMASFIHSNLLRSEGMSAESMFGTVGGAVVNIVLDPLLISVAGLGAAGAAIATVIGYVFSVAFLFVIVRTKSRMLSVSVRKCGATALELRNMFGIGLPAAVSNIMQSVAVILMNQFLLPFGNGKIAAMGIVLKVNMIALLVLTGLTFGGQPMFGYYYGAKDGKKLKELLFFCLKIIGLSALVLTVLIFAFAPRLLACFMDNSQIISDGTVMLRWQVVTMPLVGLILLMTIICQAIGEIPGSFILSVSRQGAVFLLVLVIARLALGYTGVLISQAVSDALTAALAACIFAFRVRKELSFENET